MSEKQTIGLVQIDGLYPASQFHLRTTRDMTDRERTMILYALRLPMSGLVDIQTVAMRRLIITTTIEEAQRQAMAQQYAKVINQVMNGAWLWELSSQVPAVKTVGKLFDHLHLNYQTQIIQQWPAPEMNNHKSLRWWRASGNDRLLASIREALKEREERRGQ
jgi:hypothetical protein